MNDAEVIQNKIIKYIVKYLFQETNIIENDERYLLDLFVATDEDEKEESFPIYAAQLGKENLIYFYKFQFSDRKFLVFKINQFIWFAVCDLDILNESNTVKSYKILNKSIVNLSIKECLKMLLGLLELKDCGVAIESTQIKLDKKILLLILESE